MEIASTGCYRIRYRKIACLSTGCCRIRYRAPLESPLFQEGAIPREYYRNIERALYIKDDIFALNRWEVYRAF